MISVATAVSEAPTIEICTSLFRDAVAPHGFYVFSCGEVDTKDREMSVFSVLHWPQALKDFYISSNQVQTDPIIETLRRRQSPFTWSDMRADRTFAQAGTRLLQLLAEEYGLTEGLIVPFSHGSGRFGIVSLAGNNTKTLPGSLPILCLLSMALYYRMRYLAPRLGFAVPPLGMSQRELECIGLVASGLTDRSIAKQLGISFATAHDYVEAAKSKLKARTRAEAVARAMTLGLLA
jgi:LuxR family quorum sensing-dependent transcriptional regulator